MQAPQNEVLIIGTSHISRDSFKKITEAFESFKPDHIMVELDPRRLHSLLSGESRTASLKMIRHLGFKGYLFALVGACVQRKLGRLVGVQPGADMLWAVNMARKHNKKLFLIDRDIVITLSRFSKAFTTTEKFRMLKDIFSPFSSKIRIDLNKVPSEKMIACLLNELKLRYPSLHRVLVEERNQYMARAILRIQAVHPNQKSLVVVGAGHTKSILDILTKTGCRIYSR